MITIVIYSAINGLPTSCDHPGVEYQEWTIPKLVKWFGYWIWEMFDLLQDNKLSLQSIHFTRACIHCLGRALTIQQMLQALSVWLHILRSKLRVTATSESLTGSIDQQGSHSAPWVERFQDVPRSTCPSFRMNSWTAEACRTCENHFPPPEHPETIRTLLWEQGENDAQVQDCHFFPPKKRTECTDSLCEMAGAGHISVSHPGHPWDFMTLIGKEDLSQPRQPCI